MIYLISAGLIPLVFGFTLILFPSICKMFCRACDRIIFDLDRFTANYRKIFGGLLVLAVIFIGGTAFFFPKIIHLHIFWVILLIFGLLFLFLPEKLDRLSLAANRVVFDTDKQMLAYCRTSASILILAGAYILFVSYFFAGRLG